MIFALVCVGDNLGIVTLAFRRQAIVDRKPKIGDTISEFGCVFLRRNRLELKGTGCKRVSAFFFCLSFKIMINHQ